MMVKLSLLAAFVSILAYASAQDDYDDYDDYDYDDCEEPEETTSTAAYSVTLSTAIIPAISSPMMSTCPMLPAPSTTDTITLLTPVATITEVGQATTIVYAATVTSTIPQPIDQTSITFATATVAATTKTVYFGPTFTKVVFDVVPAETTVTVPRAADFTPLKCESAYAGPYATSTYTYTSTFSTYSYTTISSDSTTTRLIAPSTLIFPSVTAVNSTTTISLQPTTTVTSTRNNPTSTVYAACQGTDNVTPDAPPSKYRYLGQPVSVRGTYSSVVAAIDQVDCCALCQANEQCTGSAFYTKPVLGESLDTYLVNTACQLFLKNGTTSATCDTSFIGATMSFDYPEIINYYSNGPCGQFNFTYFLPRLVYGDTL